MKILMVCTNSYRMIAPAPLGASLVASRLRKDGHRVRFLDLMFARDSAREAAQVARGFGPDLVCYSIRNVDNQSCMDYFDPLPGIQAVVSAVRSASPSPSLLGGTAFTTFPAQYLNILGADYGIAGDDLEPISRFVASLAAGSPDVSLPGLVHREDGQVKANPFRIKGYADVEFDGWDLMDLRPYRRSMDAFWDAGVVARTGCPFQCSFCDTYHTFGRQWVLRDPRQVAQEIVALKRIHGVRHVFMADAGFNRPLDHAKAVLEAIIAARPGVGITSVFEPGEVDAEFARLYRRAGGEAVMLFAFSLSEPVLAASRKPFQVADVFQGADVLRREGVPGFLYLTFGGPEETPATVEDTISEMARIKPAYTLVDHGFRVQPGTALRERAVAEGAILPEDDCFNATFYHSPHTPAAMLDARLRRFNREHRWGKPAALAYMARLAWDKLRP